MQNEYISKRMIFAFALRICAFFHSSRVISVQRVHVQ